MKKLLAFAGLLLLLGTLCLPAKNASAATINYNNIISDNVFDDIGTMSASQIDAFLNTFSSSCISTNKGFTAADPTGYSPSTGFRFGGNVSAGTAIYHAAQGFQVNPQVLLATLQKEQSLVTGTAGCYPNTPNKAASYQCDLYGSGKIYNCTGACPYGGGCIPIAVGYGCPGKCNADQEGFSQQIVRAAWRLSFDRHRAEGQTSWYINKPNWDSSDDANSCYSGPMTQGTYKVCPSGSASYYDGYYTTNDPASVHIDNGATAALYHYTPFKHGQLLFFNNFTNWFGSTQSTELVRSAQNPTVYLLSDSTKYPIPSYPVLDALSTFGPVSYVSQSLLDEFTTGPVMNQSIKSTSSSTVYYISNGNKYPFPSCTMMLDYGSWCGNQITLTDQQVSQLGTGPSLANVVHLTTGEDFYVKSGSAQQIFDAQSQTQAGITGPTVTLNPAALDGLPVGAPVIRNDVLAKSDTSGSYYYYANHGFTFVPTDLLSTPAFTSLPKGNLESVSLNTLPIDRGFVGFGQTGAGTKYVLDSQGKALLSNSTSWASSYTTFSDAFWAQAPDSTQPVNSMFVKADSSPTIYMVVAQTKHPVLSWTDFVNLHPDKSTTFSTLTGTTLNSLQDSTGAVAPGTLIKGPDKATVYVVNALFQKAPLKSFDISEDLGIKYYIELPKTVVDAYTTQPLASTFVQCNGKNYVGNEGLLYEVTPEIATTYGWTSKSYDPWDSLGCSNLRVATAALPQFIKTADKVTIYYVNNGVKQPIGSYATYANLGGNSSNTLIVSNNFLNQVTTGSVRP